VIAVGSDGPEKQELDVEVLARADRVVADSLPQCLRLGEIHHAVEKGAISKDEVTAELGEITAELKPGRTSDDEIIVCDLTGVGVQDVAASSLVLERALQNGKGERLWLWAGRSQAAPRRGTTERTARDRVLFSESRLSVMSTRANPFNV
jgi:ornithine cyclodeaminase/alanine dehydrogenase-like protein (mu-crystallin family)